MVAYTDGNDEMIIMMIITFVPLFNVAIPIPYPLATSTSFNSPLYNRLSLLSLAIVDDVDVDVPVYVVVDEVDNDDLIVVLVMLWFLLEL